MAVKLYYHRLQNYLVPCAWENTVGMDRGSGFRNWCQGKLPKNGRASIWPKMAKNPIKIVAFISDGFRISTLTFPWLIHFPSSRSRMKMRYESCGLFIQFWWESNGETSASETLETHFLARCIQILKLWFMSVVLKDISYNVKFPISAGH